MSNRIMKKTAKKRELAQEQAPRLEQEICPRCLESMSAVRPVALSRVASVDICSECGTDEALESFVHGRITPKDEWPITAESRH